MSGKRVESLRLVWVVKERRGERLKRPEEDEVRWSKRDEDEKDEKGLSFVCVLPCVEYGRFRGWLGGELSLLS